MNSTFLHRLIAAGATVGTTALIASCSTLGPIEHGKVIDKRSRAPWTETVTEDIYDCRTGTTRAARSSLVTGKGGKGGRGGGSGGGLFGGGSGSKPAKKPSPNGNGTSPSTRPGGNSQSPGTQQRRGCTKVGERTVGKPHPGRYELHIKADDGRTAWKNVTADTYRHTRKGDTV